MLTSVRRTALCWDAMFPRPEYTCGSSVMLCSPSCSASLSERFAPLREGKLLQTADICRAHLIENYTCTRTLLHQELTDIFKLAHVGELLLHQLLDAAAHAHRDDFQAAASWECDNVGQCDV